MGCQLPIVFPTEAEQLRRRAEAVRHLTPAQRMLAVADALAVAESLSLAGQCREGQLAYHRWLEDQWRQRMKEFIAAHVGSPITTP